MSAWRQASTTALLVACAAAGPGCALPAGTEAPAATAVNDRDRASAEPAAGAWSTRCPAATHDTTSVPLCDARTDAARGVTSPALAQLAADLWEFTLRRSPELASAVGVHALDAQVDDYSEAARTSARAEEDRLLARARALRADDLGVGDEALLGAIRARLEHDVALRVCAFELWELSPRTSELTRLSQLVAQHRDESASDDEALLRRLHAIPAQLDQIGLNLREGARRGLVSNRASLQRMIEQLRAELEAPLESSALATALARTHLTPTTRDLLRDALTAVRAALAGYTEVLERELLPVARDAAHEGLWALPNGRECYAASILVHTTQAWSPTDIAAVGAQGIAATDAEFVTRARALWPGRRFNGVADVTSRLRGDRGLFFRDAEEILGTAQRTLDRARALVRPLLPRDPAVPCEVREIPAHDAPYTSTAYYMPAVPGERTGTYYVNTHAPQTRPRFEAQVLAVHESVPGHHLQLSWSQTMPAESAITRLLYRNVGVEGWALYTERWMEDAGLYSGPLDHLGVTSYDAWRAARLVVDVGLHADGWDRDRARAYLLEHTALSEANIDAEIDRYVTWPGQALAYHTGKQAILELRAEAQARLAGAFSLSAFHAAVLDSANLPLQALRRRVRRTLGLGEP